MLGAIDCTGTGEGSRLVVGRPCGGNGRAGDWYGELRISQQSNHQMETKLASFPSKSLPSDDQWTLNDKSANFSSHQRFPGIPAHRMPFPAPALPLSS